LCAVVIVNPEAKVKQVPEMPPTADVAGLLSPPTIHEILMMADAIPRLIIVDPNANLSLAL
jgi:hypothetical protein